MQFETKAIRTQYERAHREHSVPLYLTSSFVFDDAEQARALFADEYQGNIYSRFSNEFPVGLFGEHKYKILAFCAKIAFEFS